MYKNKKTSWGNAQPLPLPRVTAPHGHGLSTGPSNFKMWIRL